MAANVSSDIRPEIASAGTVTAIPMGTIVASVNRSHPGYRSIGNRPASVNAQKIARMLSTRTNQNDSVTSVSRSEYTAATPHASVTAKVSAAHGVIAAPSITNPTPSTMKPRIESLMRATEMCRVLTRNCALAGLRRVKSSVPRRTYSMSFSKDGAKTRLTPPCTR